MKINELPGLTRLCVYRSATIVEAAGILKVQAVPGLLVVDKASHKAVGILTQKDITKAYYTQVPPDHSVTEIMNIDFPKIDENTRVEEIDFEIGRPCMAVVDKKENAVGLLGREALLEALLTGFTAIFHNNASTLKDEGIPRFSRSLNHAVKQRETDPMFYNVMEFSPDSIYVSDCDGKTLYVNQAFEQITGIGKDEVLGIHVSKIEKKGLFFPAATPLVLKEKRKITIIQETRNGKKFVVTAVPIFDDEGEIVRVVCSSKNFEDLSLLRNYLEEPEHEAFSVEKNVDWNGQDAMVYASREMASVVSLAYRVAKVDSTVLITGESGVGKDLIVRLIHHHSDRADEKLVQINCGAIPEMLLESELFGYETGAFSGAKRNGKMGLIEAAHKGTLFLDEIGEMPMNLQVKLLQVLQNKQITRVGGTSPIGVNIRVIAATNKDLLKLIKKKRFRLDLYYRLNVVPLSIPALRERKEDVLPLVRFFMKKFQDKYHKQFTLMPDVVELLEQYQWPGNIRELKNVIERTVVISKHKIIHKDALPFQFIQDDPSINKSVRVNRIVPLSVAVGEAERQVVSMAYKKCGSSYKLAEALGISQSSAHRKIQQYIKK